MGVFFRQAALFGDDPLIHYPLGGSWKAASWAEARRAVLAVAGALVEAGVETGDHVVLMGENSLEWIYCDYGIQAAGAIAVPIYWATVPEMTQVIVANCDAVLAIASGAEMAAKLRPTATLKRVVRMDLELAEWLGQPPVRKAEVAARLRAIRPDDVCTIVYTSGTTGDPKGAELAHRNLVDTTRAALLTFPLSRQDATLTWLPFSHVFERINGTFVVLMFGGQMWISRGVDHLAEDIAAVSPTIMLSVPRVYEKMYTAVMQRVRGAGGVRHALFDWAVKVGTAFSHAKHPDLLLATRHRIADRLVLASLRRRLTGGRLRFFISGGAALARDVEEFFWALGVPILNGWGMTETSSAASSNTLSNHRFLTVGRPFPGIEIKIAEDGEILVKSPGNMLGYHKNPAATAEMLKEGWIYTGDIGELDSDGFLMITDRKKDLIKTAVGKYVAPQPLEFEIQRDDLVEQAVIIGEGRPYVTALIVPDWPAVAKQIPGRPDDLVGDPRLIELIRPRIDALNQHLGNWEQVKYFTLLPNAFSEAGGEITPTLKIKRRIVAQKYAPQIESMYASKHKPS